MPLLASMLRWPVLKPKALELVWSPYPAKAAAASRAMFAMKKLDGATL